jgi:predicted HAD superfamily Cof-like phosphohydrolase
MTQPIDQSIKDFNKMYGLPVLSYPGFPFQPPVTVNLIARLKELHKILVDEVDEIGDIITMVEDKDSPTLVLTAIADLLGDIQVYCMSEMVKFGLDNQTVLTTIMASNMSKLGKDGQPIIKDGKVQKGENYWKPEPMIHRYIEAAIRQAEENIGLRDRRNEAATQRT